MGLKRRVKHFNLKIWRFWYLITASEPTESSEFGLSSPPVSRRLRMTHPLSMLPSAKNSAAYVQKTQKNSVCVLKNVEFAADFDSVIKILQQFLKKKLSTNFV